MEIQFLHNRVTEKDPKLLIDRIQRMASGEAPFFPTTLSLVFDKLVEKACTKRTPLGPGPGVCTESESPVHPTPPQASTPTSNIPPPPAINTFASSSNLQAPASTHGPVPPITTPSSTRLECRQCGRASRMRDLRENKRCPLCPAGSKKGTILMRCSSCKTLRGANTGACGRKGCRKIFL